MIESERPFADGRRTAVFVFNALRPGAGRLTRSWLTRLRAFDENGWATHAALINKDPDLERTVAAMRRSGQLPAGTVVHHYATRDRLLRPLWGAKLGPGETIDHQVGDWLDWLTGQIPGAVVFADSPAAYPYLASMSNPAVARVAAIHLIHTRGVSDPVTGPLMPKFADRFAGFLDAFDALVVMTNAQAADLRARFGEDLPVRVIPPAATKAGAAAGSADDAPAHRIVVPGGLGPEFTHEATIRACAPALRANPTLVLHLSGAEPSAVPSGEPGAGLGAVASELGIAEQLLLGSDMPPSIGHSGSGPSGSGPPSSGPPSSGPSSTRPPRSQQSANVLAGARLVIWTGSRDACPLAIPRAIQAGVPVVAVDRPYGPAEMITDPQLGLLVPPDDQEVLTSAVTNLLARRSDQDQVREAGRDVVARYDTTKVGLRWVELAEDLAYRVWDDRRPTVLAEPFGTGSRFMRVTAVLANAASGLDAWTLEVTGNSEPAAWLAPIPIVTGAGSDEEAEIHRPHTSGAVLEGHLNLRTSLMAFAVTQRDIALPLELDDGSRRAAVLSPAFQPRIIASRVGAAALSRHPDGSVWAEPIRDLLRATSSDGGMLARLTPDSEADDVTHAVDWTLDIESAPRVAPSGPAGTGNIEFTGVLRAHGIAPNDDDLPGPCVADVGGFPRMIGTLAALSEPAVEGLEWSVPVTGSLSTELLVVMTGLARRALTLHVGYQGLVAPIGSLWTHGRSRPIHLIGDRGAVTILAAPGGRLIAAPGQGRRARVSATVRGSLARG